MNASEDSADALGLNGTMQVLAGSRKNGTSVSGRKIGSKISEELVFLRIALSQPSILARDEKKQEHKQTKRMND